MVAVPAVTPVTTPVDGSTVATPGALLLHEPLAVTHARVVLDPWHTALAPVIAAGVVLVIVTVVVLEQLPVVPVTV
jgi:hypothetical protein